MKDRMLKVLLIMLKIIACLLPAIIAIYFMPVRKLIHETSGMVGFLFGVMFAASGLLVNVIVWVITGRGWLADLL